MPTDIDRLVAVAVVVVLVALAHAAGAEPGRLAIGADLEHAAVIGRAAPARRAGHPAGTVVDPQLLALLKEGQQLLRDVAIAGLAAPVEQPDFGIADLAGLVDIGTHVEGGIAFDHVLDEVVGELPADRRGREPAIVPRLGCAESDRRRNRASAPRIQATWTQIRHALRPCGPRANGLAGWA